MDVARGDLCTDRPCKAQSDANVAAAGATATPATTVATNLMSRKASPDVGWDMNEAFGDAVLQGMLMIMGETCRHNPKEDKRSAIFD
jgi:hypothetical protein